MMKIVIGYPPIASDKGVPLLSQNRQFQFFNAPTYIYPMIPAYAASNAAAQGHTVTWRDGIAERLSYTAWEDAVRQDNPDILLIETKCPVIAQHWEIIRRIKEALPHTCCVLVGDHVTYLPEESFDASPVDCIITGGDYDFLLMDLVRHLTENTPLPPGFWFPADHPKLNADDARSVTTSGARTLRTTGPAVLTHDLDTLPFIDRDLTRWELYAYKNGNFKYTPGTYVYSGRDCWWNKCTFCVWDHTLNPPGTYRSFSPERHFAEVQHIVEHYPVKEIFDDAGTLRTGAWLHRFCDLVIEEGIHKKVAFSCNMRCDGADAALYEKMARANFRFILFGVESGNQETLDRIRKGVTLSQIENGVRMCKSAGLAPHVTVMVGYPWEDHSMTQRTIDFAKSLFKKGYIDTLQATLCIPYPGTPLYAECKEKGWLRTTDYTAYDMRTPIMKSPLSDRELLQMTQSLYTSFLSPVFILRTLLRVRRWQDVRFLFMAGMRVIGHLWDFRPRVTHTHTTTDDSHNRE